MLKLCGVVIACAASYIATTLSQVTSDQRVVEYVAVVSTRDVHGPAFYNKPFTVPSVPNHDGSVNTVVWSAVLCPMAYFLVTGTNVVTLSHWNDTVSDFTPSGYFGVTGDGWRFARGVSGACM